MHGLLAPGQQTEVELQMIGATIESVGNGFIGKATIATFKAQLTESLQSLDSFDSLALVFTRLCEPVQATG